MTSHHADRSLKNALAGTRGCQLSRSQLRAATERSARDQAPLATALALGHLKRTMSDESVEIVIDTPAARLLYHPGPKIVHHEFRRFVHGADLRNVLERGAEILQRRRARSWLSDDRGNGPLKPADAEWAQTEWFPRVRDAGWRYWAVVMPEGAVGKMNMRRWIETYAALGIVARPFDDPDVAMQWLLQQTG